MLEILKGSFIDLRPELWAIIIVVAFVVIEVIQLGPHTFTQTPKGSKKRSKGGCKISRLKKCTTYNYKIDLTLNVFVKADSFLSMVEPTSSPEGNLSSDFMQFIRNEPSIHAQSAVLHPQNPGDRKNSVVVCGGGDEAEQTVLDRLDDLWNAKEGPKVSNIFFYSWRIPSIYALQKIVSLINDLPGANEVNVGIIYEKENEADGINHPGEKEEKEDYLGRHGITLERRDPM